MTINTSAKHPFGRCFPGVSFGGVPVIRFSMLGDVADLLQLQTDGKKDEGPLGITDSRMELGWLWRRDGGLVQRHDAQTPCSSIVLLMLVW